MNFLFWEKFLEKLLIVNLNLKDFFLNKKLLILKIE